MNWFIYSIMALIMWSLSDLFSKIGCRDEYDKESHLKMLFFVGMVMGAQGLIKVFFYDIEINIGIFLRYLPISLLYISSMLLGYMGLKYIELSISSPICNSSGAIVAIASFIVFGIKDFHPLQIIATFLICAGVIGIGVAEMKEDPESRLQRQEASGFFYKKSYMALFIPLAYCILDAAGTFADALVLNSGMDEESANTAYGFTFMLCGIIALIIALAKKSKFSLKFDSPKLAGSVFETIGQIFYIYALADTRHVSFSAPIISAYCILSVLWSRIFLKEKLSLRHYIAIITAIGGIVILGFFDQ